MKPEAVVTPSQMGVPFGRRSPHLRGPYSMPKHTQDTASDAARRNFAESFGRVAEQTISKNLNVQPTIRIRPGYKFNVLVDQDIIFPNSYRQ